MAVTYEFTVPDNTVAQRSSDGAFVPWDPTNHRPKDSGITYRNWVDQGSPAPAAYDPAKWPT